MAHVPQLHINRDAVSMQPPAAADTIASEPAAATERHTPPPPPSPLSSDAESSSPPSPVPPCDFFNDSAYESVDEPMPIWSIHGFGFPPLNQCRETPVTSGGSAEPNPYNDVSWYPFENMPLFLTFSLFNAPAIRFSEAQQLAILDWATEMGTPDVPSMYRLDKCKKRLKGLMGDSTRMFKTKTGHIFFVNSIETFLRQDFANHSVRKEFEFYPHDCNGRMSEVWHGEKMTLGENRGQLTPMVSHAERLFFVNELALLDDGSLFITDMFLKRQGELSARGRRLEPESTDGNQSRFRLSDEVVDCPISRFRETCVELGGTYTEGIEVSNGHRTWRDYFAPHPLRRKADGREVYSIPFVVFLDDVSGNSTKQWNKHWCCYVSNACMPREKLNERLNIRFMSTSQHTSPIEMMEAVRTVFDEAFDNPITVWDSLTSREVLVRPYILFISGDNPMQAEECSTNSLRSNFFCRTCTIGTIRTPEDTIKSIRTQYHIAFTSKSAQELTDEQRNSGVKDSIANPLLDWLAKRRQELQHTTSLTLPEITDQLRIEYAQKTGGSELQMNPLLSLRGLNVHLDTPTETLHTILLGVVKYLWLESIARMDKQHKFPLFSTRLRAASIDGLNNGPISEYIISNRGSLNGKHYKTLVQLAPFCLHDIVDDDLVSAWVAVERLTVLAWCPDIDNIDSYTNNLHLCINDFLYTVAKSVPQMIAQKAKTHLLVHMPMFVRRFGPLLGPNSERYESFNQTFRSVSVHSNRQAPSRDIANSFAVFDMVKHILTGGYWLNKDANQYICAGKSVTEFCMSSTFTQRLLGIKKPNLRPGPLGISAIFVDSIYGPWEQFVPAQITLPDTISSASSFRRVKSFLTTSGDRVEGSCNVVYTSQSGPGLELGRIHEVVASRDQVHALVIMQMYRWTELDSVLRMPIVALEKAMCVVSCMDIVCEVNMQHRCAQAGCTDGGFENIVEERLMSAATRPKIEHKDSYGYIVNTVSLHNSKTIQQLTRTRFNCSVPFQAASDYQKICASAAVWFQTRSNLATSSHNAELPEQLAQKKKSGPPTKPINSELAGMDIGASQPMSQAGPSTSRKRRRN